MYILIKNGKLYDPEYKGIYDILCFKNNIIKIGNGLEKLKDIVCINKIIDAKNKIIIPGLIDSHVHINGGGGIGYRTTRCSDISIDTLIKAGVTTAIGCLGVDCTTKSLEGLIGKAQMLEAEGITTYILTGGYHKNRVNLTGNTINDIVFIDKIIGSGEIALSEKRAIEPTFEQLKQIISESYLGGLISEKSGVSVLHIGGGKKKTFLINKIIEETEVPLNKLVVTHVNRNKEILKEALSFALQGINIDVTTGLRPDRAADASIKASKAIKWLIEKGVPINKITMSTDGNSGRALSDSDGNLKRFFLNEIGFLFNEFKDLVQIENIKIEEALKLITINPSSIYNLKNKGKISEGYDADLVILTNDLVIDNVIARGRILTL